MSRMVKIVFIVLAIIILVIFGINLFVVLSTRKYIVSEKNAAGIGDVDCIIVLGCGVKNNKPTPMLEDRLLEGIRLYKNGTSAKIIMTGDHGRQEYDEVNVMKQFAIDKGVPSEDIFMDHAGFSSYDSIYRAKEIFQANKVVIVTQKYHLYRSIYIAKKLGMEAYGVASNPRPYAGQWAREAREIVARNKDFFKVLIKPQSTYLGETIPVSGNGNATNDKWYILIMEKLENEIYNLHKV